MNVRQNVLSLGFAACALLFAALAIIGGINSYSPVPFMDMWDGYLGFYEKLRAGDWQVWWAQHNEHRIVLARLFFWLDFTFSNGAGWLLLVVNYVLLGLVCLLFWLIWQQQCPNQQNWLGFFLLAWLTLWVQENNLTWGFQSQFILAQLLPLAGLYALHLAVNRPQARRRYFLMGTTCGILALGSMANGLLTLPILTMYALFIRLERRYCLTLLFCSLIGAAAYLYDYVSPGQHSSVTQALLHQPGALLQYVFIYLGSPFAYLFAFVAPMKISAQVSGLLFLLALLARLINAWQQRSDSLTWALLFFVLFIVGTALATGGGRVVFGVEQALSSRYTTPALMAWAALFCLYAKPISHYCAQPQRHRWLFFVLLLSLMLVTQLGALQDRSQYLFHQRVSALAIELEIADTQQIANTYPSATGAISSSRQARLDNVSIFAQTPIRDAQQQLGQLITSPPTRPCKGFIDHVRQPVDAPNYIQVIGWFYDEQQQQTPQMIYFVDPRQHIVGMALSGMARADVARTINNGALFSGFIGYLRTDSIGQTLSMRDITTGCQVEIKTQ